MENEPKRLQLKPELEPEGSERLTPRVDKAAAKPIPLAKKVFLGCLVGVIGIFLARQSSEPGGATDGSSPVGKYSSYMTDATYEGVYADFQKQLPDLARSSPNIRMITIPAVSPDADNPYDWQMVTPYGPCADVVAGVNRRYVVVLDEGYRSKGSVLNTLYSDRASATKVAEAYCHRWFATAQPAPNQLLWFKPDTAK